MNKRRKKEIKERKREFAMMSYGVLIGVFTSLMTGIFITSLFEILHDDYSSEFVKNFLWAISSSWYWLIISLIGIIIIFFMHDCIHEKFESFVNSESDKKGSKIILKCMWKKIKFWKNKK